MKLATEAISDYPAPGVELRLIQRHVRLSGRRILELGCGDGRLTHELASVASDVVAIDPDATKIAAARQSAISEGITNVSFRVASAERLRVRGKPFEVVLFSWSL